MTGDESESSLSFNLHIEAQSSFFPEGCRYCSFMESYCMLPLIAGMTSGTNAKRVGDHLINVAKTIRSLEQN